MIQSEVLFSILLQKKLITENQAQELLKEAKSLGKRPEFLLFEKELVPEEEIAQIKAEILKLPTKFFKKDEKIPQEILNLIPEDVARHYQVIVFNKDENNLYLGMVYPDDTSAQEALRFIARRLNLELKVYIITHSDLKRILKEYQTFAQELEKLLKDFQQRFAGKKRSIISHRAIDIEATDKVIFEEAPIVKLFAFILKYAVRSRASDIHLEPKRDSLRIRFRIDGTLSTVISLPIEVHPAIISRLKIMTNLKIDETRLPQDGRFRTFIDEKEIDFRVSTLPTSMGEKAAIRILDATLGLKDIKELGLNEWSLKNIEEGIKKPFGMILLTGPTGSGKTTTLYAILQILNKEDFNIVSLEDPVEYTIEGINQSQVIPEIDYTFSRGLRHIVRQDPDMIMVGEIRDNETAELAIHAALTGHLVLSTLHTNNAVGVIPRLIDMKIEPFLLPSSLNLMIAQRLLRRLCQECCQQTNATPEEEKIIEESISQLSPDIRQKLIFKKPYQISKPVGCANCGQKGYTGRIGIFEVFKMTPSLEHLILTQVSQVKLNEEAQRQGMITLRQDGILKVLAGLTSLEEVLIAT